MVTSSGFSAYLGFWWRRTWYTAQAMPGAKPVPRASATPNA